MAEILSQAKGLFRVARVQGAKHPALQIWEQASWGSRLIVSPNEYHYYGLYMKGRTAKQAMRFGAEVRTKSRLMSINPRPEELKDKLRFAENFAREGLRVPATDAVVVTHGGRRGDLEKYGRQILSSSELADLLAARLRAGRETALKRTDGIMGIGVRVVTGFAGADTGSQSPVLLSNGDEVLLGDLTSDLFRKGGTWVVQERIANHPIVDEMNASTLNAMRVVTFLRSNGEVDVDCAVMRVGRSDSQSNALASGGIAIPIDVDTGFLEKWGHVKPSYGLAPLERHPDSGVVFRDVGLPFWQDVIRMVTRAAELAAPNRYVGWDVVLTPDGPLLLEGNPDLDSKATQTGTDGMLTPEFLSRMKEEAGLTFRTKVPLVPRPLKALATLFPALMTNSKAAEEMRDGRKRVV